MYIAHYKAVNSSDEFFSSKRQELNFPTQIEYNGQRYSLNATHIVATPRQELSIANRAKTLNIPFGVGIA